MRGYFVSTDWRAPLTVFLIILFFVPLLFLLAYKLGEHIRDNYYLPSITEQVPKETGAERKREIGQEWGAQIAARISRVPFTKINGGWSKSCLSQRRRHR